MESAITTHIDWVKTLKTMADKMEIQPLQVDGHKCGLGHFYESVTPKDEDIKKVWDKIDSVHLELHQIGHVVINKIKFGDKIGAANNAKKAGELSSDKLQMEKIISPLLFLYGVTLPHSYYVKNKEAILLLEYYNIIAF